MMSFVMYLGMMALLLVFGGLVVKRVPFYRELLLVGQPGRYVALDGLRGYLALAVFVHHGAVQRVFYQTGVWNFPPSRFFRALAPTAIMYFFMITGFLFWSKAIDKHGRVPAIPLYIGRVRRLAPLYLFSMALLLLIVAVQSGFRLRVNPATLATELAGAISLGLGQIQWINGVDTSPINAGVTWTLHFEWVFYLALPLLALMAFPSTMGACIALYAAVGVSYLLLRTQIPWLDEYCYRSLPFWARFLGGMVAAHLARVAGGGAIATRRWFGCVVVVLLALSLWNFDGWVGVAIGAAAFLCLVYGNDLFGLLSLPGSRFLGTISYSVYLLHGVVLWLGLRIANRFLPVASLNDAGYWALVLGCGGAVVAFSAVTYRHIEHPFLVRPQRAPSVSGGPVQPKTQNAAGAATPT
jgi:peptidoglycan/LPS O-acetylase OafA/YrhL